MKSFVKILSLLFVLLFDSGRATTVHEGRIIIGHDLIIPTDDLHLGHRRFPVTLIDAAELSGSRLVANIQFLHALERVQCSVAETAGGGALGGGGDGGGSMNIDLVSVDTNQGAAEIPTNFWMPRIPADQLHSCAELFLSGTFWSQSMLRFRSFVHVPTNGTHGQLIFRPRNPSSYALDNQLYYVSVSDAPRMISVQATVRINRPHEQTTTNYSAAPLPEFQRTYLDKNTLNFEIPQSTYNDLISQLENLDMWVEQSNVDDHIRQYFVHNVTEHKMNLLPSLEYLVRMDDDVVLSISTITPREYIGGGGEGTSEVRRPFLVQIGTSISSLILNKMVIHVDGTNSRIGFGEPLNEIL